MLTKGGVTLPAQNKRRGNRSLVYDGQWESDAIVAPVSARHRVHGTILVLPVVWQMLASALKEKQSQAGMLEEFLYSLPDINNDGVISRYEVGDNVCPRPPVSMPRRLIGEIPWVPLCRAQRLRFRDWQCDLLFRLPVLCPLDGIRQEGNGATRIQCRANGMIRAGGTHEAGSPKCEGQ